MERDEAERFAAKVESEREARGLSVRAAAAASGSLISPTTWTAAEDPEALVNRRIRAKALRGIAAALSIDEAEVFAWAGRPYAQVRHEAAHEGRSEEIAAIRAALEESYRDAMRRLDDIERRI